MAQLKLNPSEETVAEIRRQAQKAGISVNAYLSPLLNDIAAGRLVYAAHIPAPKKEQPS